MKLNLEGIRNPQFAEKGYILPKFDIEAVRAETAKAPQWVHFGAGNILRAFPCVLLQKLIESGDMKTGMCVVECYDEDIIDKAFDPYDNLCLAVSLKKDGTVDKRVVASVAEAHGYHKDKARVEEIMTSPSLQMVSMTITEKGYAVVDGQGNPLPFCKGDFDSMEAPVSIIGKLAYMLNLRYKAGQLPVAMVSMDNCSHNGTILKNAIDLIVNSWLAKGLVDQGFVDYLNSDKVSFTWSMIDKITPRPAQSVLDILAADELEGMNAVETVKHTFVSGMVNAEECEYLAIEDKFPNGRPALEKVGVIFGDRDTVDRIEKMKVCTCLNPLHTCLAIFGCVLGMDKISTEMSDPMLVELVKKVGYVEGLPVVVDPKVMSAKKFIDEVVEQRLPNPFMPDTPQRIACDTSKKLPVRFGETMKAYMAEGKTDLSFLNFIPAVLAGYGRYLMGIGDDGNAFEKSPDPNMDKLTAIVASIKLGDKVDAETLKPLYSDKEIFGVDLFQCGLGDKVVALFNEMNAGPGAVRATITRLLAENK
ncbi:MAG: mannitol dehydrogenase family protein [Clostridia bacterium]|nr:mannitol dehydrogenase family protein [Clostridia bacterium]